MTFPEYKKGKSIQVKRKPPCFCTELTQGTSIHWRCKDKPFKHMLFHVGAVEHSQLLVAGTGLRVSTKSRGIHSPMSSPNDMGKSCSRQRITITDSYKCSRIVSAAPHIAFLSSAISFSGHGTSVLMSQILSVTCCALQVKLYQQSQVMLCQSVLKPSYLSEVTASNSHAHTSEQHKFQQYIAPIYCCQHGFR